MYKNTASKLIVFCWDTTTGLPKTGDAANLTAYRSLDFGTVTVLADTSATEMDSTNAKGYYLFDLAQGETNGDINLYTCKSSTSNLACVGVPAVVHTIPATGILAPATAGRTLVVDAAGLADANAVKVGPSGSGTAQTARDIGLSVLLSAGTGTGQLDFTSGVVKANATQLAAQTITAAAGVTFPSSVASPTNITAGTITTVTNLTNAPTSGDFTSTMKTSIGTAVAASAVASVTAGVTVTTNNDKTGYSLASAPPTAAAIATAVWTDLTASSDFSTANSVGALLKADINAPIGSIPTSPYTGTPPTAAAIASAVWQDITAGDFTVSGSIGKSLGGAFAALGTSVFTTGALANAPSGGGGGGDGTVTGYATGQDPATLVLDALAASHATPGTIGHAIGAAGAAADPLATSVPGAYTGDQAGAVIAATKARLDLIGSAQITLVSPVTGPDDTIRIARGFDYHAAVGRAISFVSDSWPSLSGATVRLRLPGLGAVTGTASGSGTQTIQFELTHTQSALVRSGRYSAEATLAGGDGVDLIDDGAVIAT